MTGVNRMVVGAVVFGLIGGVLSGRVAAEELSGRGLLDRTLEAHGGLERWQSFGQYRYSVKEFPLGDKAPFDFTQTVDLRHRHHHIVGTGTLSGFDGKSGWATPSIEAVGISPRFYTNGNFYFAAIPFVFADPGIQLRNLGQVEFHGKTYDRVGVSYEKNIGQSSLDSYVLFLDAQTHRLHLIHFTVTALAKDPAQAPHKALVYEQWQTADGLLVPGKLTFYAWSDDELQGDGATYTITNPSFAKDQPDPAIFQVPQGAQLD